VNASLRPPSPREIAELLAWARRLTQAGPGVDPAERAAYLAAKTDVLARITDPGPTRSDGADPVGADRVDTAVPGTTIEEPR
jgi:hypothetical protein